MGHVFAMHDRADVNQHHARDILNPIKAMLGAELRILNLADNRMYADERSGKKFRAKGAAAGRDAAAGRP